MDAARTERVNRYKDERRKQLALQFGNLKASESSTKKAISKETSSGSEEPHTVRSTRNVLNLADTEKIVTSSGRDAQNISRLERDKSSKRKSNLNRSLNSEEVPQINAPDDVLNRRRRRRFFPPEVLQQSAKDTVSINGTSKSDITTAIKSDSSSSAAIARISPKKSELSIHMENARKGRLVSYSEMGKQSRNSPKRTPEKAAKSSSTSDIDINNSISDRNNVKLANKENIKGNSKQEKSNTQNLSDDQLAVKQRRSSNVSKRMDELAARTRETLARVERLTNKPSDDAKKVASSKWKTVTDTLEGPIKDNSLLENKNETKTDNRVLSICDSSKTTHSILKKKSIEEPHIDVVSTISRTLPISVPISILKRKVSQDEGVTSSSPPVTFSPSVVDPSTNRKKPGILKKRRSLDEAQVLRHRSCSPESSFNRKTDSRSILKNQRRSSLEDIIRNRSPESGLHGILKRRSSRCEVELDPPTNSPEPQSILKRRSGSNSANYNVNSPHVSIATAVILAAAGGAEIVLDSAETVRPILKKKSFSDDQPYNESYCVNETPRPILKKKSSTDTDDYEDKPKRPILKNTTKTPMEDGDNVGFSKCSYQKFSGDLTECEIKPILKQTSSRENSPRPRLSFYTDDGVALHHKSSRRSHSVGRDFCSTTSKDEGSQQGSPVSVLDMVVNIEKRLSTGAIPKKSNSRKSERHRTQPVTHHEFEASLSLVKKPLQPDSQTALNYFPLSNSGLISTDANKPNAHSLLDLTLFDGDNSLLSGSFPNTIFDRRISGGKMSSDSAFQSLGDGLELDHDADLPSPKTPQIIPSKLDPTKIQMKTLAEEARKLQLRKDKSRSTNYHDINRTSSSRFSTQPVTVCEVQEASRFKDNKDEGPEIDVERDAREPSRLSLSERIKMFSAKLPDEKPQKTSRRFYRFRTQPITSQEVESAQCFPNSKSSSFALDEETSVQERKGILKSSDRKKVPPKRPDKFKSVLKKTDSSHQHSSPLRSILKPETGDFARDEGISSDESRSGSEVESSAKSVSSDKECRFPKGVINDKFLLEKCSDIKNSSEDTIQTSDGDSSNGREVSRILGTNSNAKTRTTRNNLNNETTILKSKSQGVVQDEEVTENRKVRRSMTQTAMPKTIAELQAKLQKSGDNEWKKRIPKLNNANEELNLLNVKNIYNEELSEKTTILAARKDELDAAAKQWKNRIEQSDAVNFSVAGRMQQSNELPTTPINIPAPDKLKRTPRAKPFKSKEDGNVSNQTLSTPVSPAKNIDLGVRRSISFPTSQENDPLQGSHNPSPKTSSKKVIIERPDNITFTSFFESIEVNKKHDLSEISIDDFDSVVRQTGNLLVQKRTVRAQRKHEASRNPVKALAARRDIKDEYTEVITGVAEREQHRINIEKLAKSSNFAVEALAGLASKEDFSSVALKRTSSWNSSLPPYKDLMLLQVKGRRYVQTRLVEPITSSINDGDNYILITPDCVFNYIGAYSNVIEQSRAADIVNSIHQTGDLGCRAEKIITINLKKVGSSTDVEKFWKTLGCSSKDTEIAPAGHPDEDEIYESSILRTNMIYEYKQKELIPLDRYWGSMPRIEMLNPLKIFVFDFGSEMYVWSGKNALLEDKKIGIKLAQELWSEGYNYTECGVSPIGISSLLGSRQQETTALLKANNRPKWALFAKITQHRETILFKEKFSDWPDYSRVIKVKHDENEKSIEVKFDFHACDVVQMSAKNRSEPDLELDGVHLGRGESYFDEESNRLFNFTNQSVTCWVIFEFSREQLEDQSVGQFYDGNSYIIRWKYCANITGRELSGKPSKYAQAGRDHCVFFYWQGVDATINEKGAAALLTVKLDSEHARQIRVLQGFEPPVFLGLFNGGMVVHNGKKEKPNESNSRLYICRGEIERETFLTEVPCSMRSLRSRAPFVLVNSTSGRVMLWYGAKVTKQCKSVSEKAAKRIIDHRMEEFGIYHCDKVSFAIVEEGSESEEFLNALGGEKRQLYLSLAKSLQEFNYTLRLFHLSSISGNFEANEVLSPLRSEHITAYPFLQSELYSASQPSLFMVDNGDEVWLWQGWWPERDDADLKLNDQTGSGAVRWQEERKAAMQTVVNYCHYNSKTEKSIPAYSVWAGLEPLAFTNLFPFWRDRDHVTKLNIQEGRKAGEAIVVEKELALLTRSTYPLDQLLQRPLPDGVDPTRLENYLSSQDFFTLISMTLLDFQQLPAWKQTALKKEKGLF